MNSLLCIKEALQLLLDIFRRLMSNQHADLQEGLQVSLCMMLHGLFLLTDIPGFVRSRTEI